MKKSISISELQTQGTEAVRKLRRQTLLNGHPFMVNSAELPEDEFFLEYPDGSIKLASISSEKRDFIILKEFSAEDETSIRRQYHLLD